MAQEFFDWQYLDLNGNMTFLFCFCSHNCALPVLIEAYFLLILFGIYDNLTKDHVPGLQKYDMCMTEQVSGPQGVKIVGRHIASAPKEIICLIVPLPGSGLIDSLFPGQWTIFNKNKNQNNC